MTIYYTSALALALADAVISIYQQLITVTLNYLLAVFILIEILIDTLFSSLRLYYCYLGDTCFQLYSKEHKAH